MADSGSSKFGDSSVLELTGKIMVVTIILLFFIIVFVFCLHLYAKWYWYRRQENRSRPATRRRGLNSAAPETTALRRSLDPSVLKGIPIIIFDPKEFKDGLECAVCLCEVSEGEKARLLPKCNHGFHVECIDMWFQSHSTCPICRNPVANQKNPAADDADLEGVIQIPSGESSGANILSPNFPTNVLFWGDETQVSTFSPCAEEVRQSSVIDEASSSSSSKGSTSNRPDVVLVIDISGLVNEEDEQKSPVPTRLRSLKRLLSGGNRRVNPSSPRNLDVEQGS